MLSIRTKSGYPYRVFVMAGTREQASILAARIHLAPTEYKYVTDDNSFCGIRCGIVITTGTYYKLDNALDILMRARQRGLLVVNADELIPLTNLVVQLQNRSSGEDNG